MASVSPRENRLASIPQIEVTDADAAGRIFSPLSILNCFGTMSSKSSSDTPLQALEDRFLTPIFEDKNILIVHDGRYVFYIRKHDSIIIAKLYCGHITEVLTASEKIFVRALVVDFKMKSFVSAELREFELGLCEVSARVLEQNDVELKDFSKWGSVIDALVVDKDLYILEDRGHMALLSKIDLRYGAQEQFRVEAFNAKESHIYFIRVGVAGQVEVIQVTPTGEVKIIYCYYTPRV